MNGSAIPSIQDFVKAASAVIMTTMHPMDVHVRGALDSEGQNASSETPALREGEHSIFPSYSPRLTWRWSRMNRIITFAYLKSMGIQPMIGEKFGLSLPN
ncbi:hypothetical protein ACHAXS_009424 [Conticribra weissflogii]